MGVPAFRFLGLILILHFLGCAGNGLKPMTMSYELPQELPQDTRDHFEIKEMKSTPGTQAAGSPLVATASAPSAVASSSRKYRRKVRNRKLTAVDPHLPSTSAASAAAASAANSTVQSSFVYPKRRPSRDPIWVGERLRYSISYFGVEAGEFVLQVLPFKQIAQRKVYHIRGKALTSPVFGLFYRLNDEVESFIDYEGIFSHRFHILLDETKQVRNSLELNDSEKGQTYFYNRWNHKISGYKESKEFAPVPPFAQDSLSALYYVRTVPLTLGESFSFPVISEAKTVEATCTVLRREKMRTPLGRIDTIVIQPEMKYQGILKKNGDSYLWLSDDERRIPVRLEAKVRIGSVVASLKQVELGAENGATDGVLEPVALPSLGPAVISSP